MLLGHEYSCIWLHNDNMIKELLLQWKELVLLRLLIDRPNVDRDINHTVSTKHNRIELGLVTHITLQDKDIPVVIMSWYLLITAEKHPITV
jgi:hypothetical protein